MPLHYLTIKLKNHSIYAKTTLLLMLGYPALVLILKGSTSFIFFAFLLVSIGYLFSNRRSMRLPLWDGTSITFAFAMTTPVIAIFLSQLYHNNFSSPPYDSPSRFLLTIPIYLMLRQINAGMITIIQFGQPFGLFAGLLLLLSAPYNWDGVRLTTGQFINLIHFSDIVLILAFLTLISINWGTRDRPALIIFKFGAFMCGIYMIIQAGERGCWLAIPPLVLITLISHTRKKIWKKMGGAIVATVLAVYIGYLTIGTMHNRIDLAFTDISAFVHGDKDTSIGVRIQLWQAAWHFFIENPLFGIGPGNFADSMEALQVNKTLTAEAAKMGRAEVHSELLSKCAETGVFGLLSSLLVLLAPLVLFIRASSVEDPIQKASGFMGIALVVGFFIFGLTAEIFNLKMTVSFYCLTLAALLACATNKTDAPPPLHHMN